MVFYMLKGKEELLIKKKVASYTHQVISPKSEKGK